MSPASTALQEPPCRPASVLEVLLAFSAMALQGFGGVLPVAQRMLVERRRWLSSTEFVEMLALAQVLPGPNVVNLALMFGDRHFGVRGALAAMLGLLGVPLVIVVLMAALYSQLASLPAVAGALRGMGAVSAGLVVGTALKLAPSLRGNPLGPILAAVMLIGAALAVGWLRVPLVWVVLGLGAISMAIAAWRLPR